MSESLRPWGATRLAPFTGPAGTGYARLELDPNTQTTRYLDQDGQPIEAGKHGTSKSQHTSNPTSGGDGGGKKPPEADDANVTDYVQD
ncbi:putative ATP-grasp-modified RiPP [Actinomadura litoris]|uniref:putative ATP-grasp-modified RiPP n=1 Tax=Actinomadura litoris TaxID=2678616 RepID=UPI001FA7C481|nr:putative ATP-grasp-modified RiPP [Actinomadura litoris]